MTNSLRLRVQWGVFAAVLVAIVLVAIFVEQTPNPVPSPWGAVPPACTTAGDQTPREVLVLSDLTPTRTASVHVGDVFELSFPDVNGLRLRVPKQKPALTCSLGPATGGPTATLLVRALQSGTVRFNTTIAGYSGHIERPIVSGIANIE